MAGTRLAAHDISLKKGGSTVSEVGSVAITPAAIAEAYRSDVLARGVTILSNRGSAESQIPAQIGGRGIGRPLEAEGRHEAPRLVHQIDDGRVVHGVAALLERDFLEIDAVG